MAMKRLLVAFVAAAALASPPTAFGGYWSWGHNYVGASVNTFVDSGWNYWLDQYLHKHSGDGIFHGWYYQSGTFCSDSMVGASKEHYHLVADLGCGGYLRNFVHWDFGNSSYLFLDSVA